MEIARNWKDYEILDMANGEKLERWGNVVLIRPDPQIIWKEKKFPEKWVRRGISISYSKLADVCCIREDFDGAQKYYLECLEIDEALAQEKRTVEERRSLVVH